MTELQAIARILNRPEEQLRVPIDLLRQGYDPEFLATYRADETGHMDRGTLARLSRANDYVMRVSAHRKFVTELLSQDNLWSEATGALLDEAQSIAEIDMLTRGLRSRKSSRAIVDRQAEVAKLGEAFLTMEGEAPADLEAWVAEKMSVNAEDAKSLLSQVRRWLQLLLHEDPMLMSKLARLIKKKAVVSLTLLNLDDNAPEPKEGEEVAAAVASGEVPAASEATAGEVAATEAPASEGLPSGTTDGASPATPVVESSVEAVMEQVASGDGVSADGIVVPVAEAVELAAKGESKEDLTFTPPRSGALNVARRSSKKSGAKEAANTKRGKSDKQLSPRQRRRRWLRGVLESYAKLRRRLSPYQILMLGRGQRSQLIKLNLEYELGGLVHAAREALSPGRHPLHLWLLEVAEEGLKKVILPRLEQDLLSELEEAAHHNLMETAIGHLHDSLSQRPVRGRTILSIDAIGPKAAAIAVVNAHGEVLHTDEIPCNSSRGDTVSANVALMGQVIHRYRVNLVVLSNGPARRFLIHTLKELLKQSSGALHWTMVDRAGADAYCATRLCLQELPQISRRHRAAVWLAWRVQDPLRQLLKVDPTRLRLGSYQRELPDDLLQTSLNQAVSEALACNGVDVWNANDLTLSRVPGVSKEIAKAVAKMRNEGELSTRHQLLESLRAQWPESQHRQAIGFLRLFGSEEPLDATAIHPEDYRLAQRLIANAGMPAPPNAPENWQRPSQPLPEEESLAELPEDAESPSESGASEEGEVVAEVETSAAAELSSSLETDAGASCEAVAATESVELAADAGALEEPAGGADGTSTEDSAGQPIEMAAASENTSSENTASESAASEMPKIVIEPVVLPSLAPEKVAELSIDVEKLARGWQVGRERLRYVARALQRPFGDFRDLQPSIPLLNCVPSLQDLKPGMTAWAVIIGVAEFGAFADIGPDCSGLIHVSRLSKDFVNDPNQVVQIGDLVQVWVMDVDVAKKRVALSALPPGVQQNRGGFSDSAHDREGSPRGRGQGASQGSNQGGGRGTGRPQQRGAPSQRGDGRSSVGAGSGGGRGRDDRGGRPGNRPGGGGGQRNDRGRGGGRRYDRQDEGSDHAVYEKKARVEQPKPAQPISDAMQKGKEPLRSFSDLMQFYQGKREDVSTVELPEASTAMDANQVESGEATES